MPASQTEKLPPNLDEIDTTDPEWAPLIPTSEHHANLLMTRELLLLVADSFQWVGLVCVATIPVSFLNYIHPQNVRGVNVLALAVAGVGSLYGMREYFGIYRARWGGRNSRGVYAPR